MHALQTRARWLHWERARPDTTGNLFLLIQQSFYLSHRVSSAKLADKILVLDDGVIVEQGTNEGLLAKGGVYKELYDKQLQEEVVDEE